MIGVRVKIMPPDAYFPDRIKISSCSTEEEKTSVPAEAKPAHTSATSNRRSWQNQSLKYKQQKCKTNTKEGEAKQ